MIAFLQKKKKKKKKRYRQFRISICPENNNPFAIGIYLLKMHIIYVLSKCNIIQIPNLVIYLPNSLPMVLSLPRRNSSHMACLSAVKCLCIASKLLRNPITFQVHAQPQSPSTNTKIQLEIRAVHSVSIINFRFIYYCLLLLKILSVSVNS